MSKEIDYRTTADKLISITCDPEGTVCCFNCKEENELMTEIIKEVQVLEDLCCRLVSN